MLGITCTSINAAGNYDDSRWFVNYYNSQISSTVFALKNRNGSVPPIVYKQLLEKTLSWFTEVGRTHGLERWPRDLKQAPREVYNSRKISCGPGSRAAPMNTSADKIIVTRRYL